jgi:hypothetical protein
MNTSDDEGTQIIKRDEMPTQPIDTIPQWWADTDPSIPVYRPRFSRLRFRLQMWAIVATLFIMSILSGIYYGANS